MCAFTKKRGGRFVYKKCLTTKSAHPRVCAFCVLIKDEQIVGTQDKSQWIVAQRLLSHLQYLDATKSSTKDLSLAQFEIMISWQ